MAGRHYDTDELQLIATLRDRGLSISAIARELGRTPSGIQGALRARRWVDPARSKLMSSVSVFSPSSGMLFENLSIREPPTTLPPRSEIYGTSTSRRGNGRP